MISISFLIYKNVVPEKNITKNDINEICHAVGAASAAKLGTDACNGSGDCWFFASNKSDAEMFRTFKKFQKIRAAKFNVINKTGFIGMEYKSPEYKNMFFFDCIKIKQLP